MSADTSVTAEMDADVSDSAADQPRCHEARVMSGLGFAGARDLFLERTESFVLVGRLSWPSGELELDGAVTAGFPAR